MLGIAIQSVLLLTVVTIATGQESKPCHTLYSQRAISLDAGPAALKSPDGKKSVLAKRVEDLSGEPQLSYRITVAGNTFRADLPGFDAEVAWSPDSRALAVTETEGGGGIGYRVYVFYVDPSGIRELDVSRPIEKDFGNPVRCDVKIPPNTGFISWGNDSSSLLVAAEVIHVSLCDCMGTYRVYEMKLPALTIARTYSQIEAKKRFSDELGCELRGADDHCVELFERSFHRRRSGAIREHRVAPGGK